MFEPRPEPHLCRRCPPSLLLLPMTLTTSSSSPRSSPASSSRPRTPTRSALAKARCATAAASPARALLIVYGTEGAKIAGKASSYASDDSSSIGDYSPMASKHHIKALADRFMKQGAEDLWNKDDGPSNPPPGNATQEAALAASKLPVCGFPRHRKPSSGKPSGCPQPPSALVCPTTKPPSTPAVMSPPVTVAGSARALGRHEAEERRKIEEEEKRKKRKEKKRKKKEKEEKKKKNRKMKKN